MVRSGVPRRRLTIGEAPLATISSSVTPPGARICGTGGGNCLAGAPAPATTGNGGGESGLVTGGGGKGGGGGLAGASAAEASGGTGAATAPSAGITGGASSDGAEAAAASGVTGAAPAGARIRSLTFGGSVVTAGSVGGGTDSATGAIGAAGAASGGAAGVGSGAAATVSVAAAGSSEIRGLSRARSGGGAAGVSAAGASGAGVGPADAAAAVSAAIDSFGLSLSCLGISLAGAAASSGAGTGGDEGGAAGGETGGCARGLRRNGGGVDSSLMQGIDKQVLAFHETKKIHSRSNRTSFTIRLTMTKLNATLLACLAAGVVFADTGCHYLHRHKKPKESSDIASDTDAEFRRRTVEKRTADLVSQGKDAAAARQQAEEEFAARYPYLTDKTKKK